MRQYTYAHSVVHSLPLVRESDSDDPRRAGESDARGSQGRRANDSPSLPIRFSLGRLTATPGALAAMERAGVDPVQYLARHATCDWGDVDAHDRAANDRAMVDGERLLSVFQLPGGTRLYILTEADRSATTFLLPEEY